MNHFSDFNQFRQSVRQPKDFFLFFPSKIPNNGERSIAEVVVIHFDLSKTVPAIEHRTTFPLRTLSPFRSQNRTTSLQLMNDSRAEGRGQYEHAKCGVRHRLWFTEPNHLSSADER